MTREEGFKEILDLISSKTARIAADLICSLFVDEGFRFQFEKDDQLEQDRKDFEPSNLKFRIDQYAADIISIRQITKEIMDRLNALEQAMRNAVCMKDVQTVVKAEVDELKDQYIDLQKQINGQTMAIKALNHRTSGDEFYRVIQALVDDRLSIWGAGHLNSAHKLQPSQQPSEELNTDLRDKIATCLVSSLSPPWNKSVEIINIFRQAGWGPRQEAK